MSLKKVARYGVLSLVKDELVFVSDDKQAATRQFNILVTRSIFEKSRN